MEKIMFTKVTLFLNINHFIKGKTRKKEVQFTLNSKKNKKCQPNIVHFAIIIPRTHKTFTCLGSLHSSVKPYILKRT